MSRKKIMLFSLGAGLLLVIVSAFLITATPVKAQCGSQVSSCKNCHETQAQDPVNNDGKAWHAQHAFGDFCYLCHGGNNQATDKVAAHTGMTAPLADVNTSCKGCHPSDVTTKAQVYAVTLGQQVGTGGGSPPAPASQANPTAAAAAPTPAPVAVQVAAVAPADMVDYAQRYDQVALGKKPVNVGNVVILALIGVLVLGGGFFVARREGWISVTFEEPKRTRVKEKYPADVVAMLPDLTHLKPAARRALRDILAKPQAAADLFASVDRLIQVEPAEDEPSEDREE